MGGGVCMYMHIKHKIQLAISMVRINVKKQMLHRTIKSRQDLNEQSPLVSKLSESIGVGGLINSNK